MSSATKLPENDIKLHIGGWEPRPGWFVLDVNPGAHVDHVGKCQDLSFLKDASCSEIYASHVLEHLGYNGELQETLKGFHRVLRPGGRLRVAVPDLDVLCRLFLHPGMPVQDRFHVMRMMFGGRMDAHDVHYAGLNLDFLGNFLADAGFRDIKKVSEFKEFNDTSSLRFGGVLISLNIDALK